MDGYGEIKATPIKREWAMKVANALRAGRDIGNKVDIPVLGGLGDVFIGKSPEGFERVAYDEPLTKGAGWTTKPTDELTDMVFLGMDVAPMARAATRGAAKAATKGSDRLVQAIAKNKNVTGMDAIKAAGELSPVKQMAEWRGSREIPISDLKLNEDGSSIAKQAWFWDKNYQHKNTDPISVVKLPTGEPYVLDGYHRIEQARRNGQKNIAMKDVPLTDEIRQMLINDKVLDGAIK